MPLSLDYSIWKACAGGAARVPSIGSRLFYFPEGHAEYATSPPNFSHLPRSPPFFNCVVTDVSLLANLESDEVYAQISLDPRASNAAAAVATRHTSPGEDSPASSFAKVLTPSDANNGGGFSVPRFCAESIFPPLDHAMDPPSQIIYVLDVHGRSWKFRHIYRGTPRRHLLTSGWSDFVNTKKLISGDTVVFIRNVAGQLFVGIRRSGRSYAGPINFETRKQQECGGGNKLVFSRGTRGRVLPESVIEAVRSADMGKPFQVLFYPRAGMPEFLVSKETVEAAMAVPWVPGLRIKMPADSDELSRTTWLQGTVSYAAVPEHGRWASSLWRMLQIVWDEPEVLQRLRAVSPWQVELIASIPMKKPKLSECLKVSADGHGSMTFPFDGFGSAEMANLTPSPCTTNTSPFGTQGARHFFSSLSSNFVPLGTNHPVFSGDAHGFDMPWRPNLSRPEGMTPVVKEIIEIDGPCKPMTKLRKGSIQLFGQIIEIEQLDDGNVSTEFSLSFAHNQLLDKQIRIPAVGACE
ncbi:Auxin response factor 17 [Platanthera zijinensis]|uniref:Auxin response factor n=1 Tax=Platanthera zijinensis TaxID=2320716 RepID=A0AAP0B4S4_9ASPA